MKANADKIFQKKKIEAAAGISSNNLAMQLKDNRPQSVLYQKQVNALSNAKPVQRQANNTGLPDNLKSGVESLSGHAMDDVRVHYNSDKPAQLNAHAYAQGTDIHLASGQEKHLPHEAWHVAQQKQGRVMPTMQMKGKINVNDDEGLEKEADVMGAKAVQVKSYSGKNSASVVNGHFVKSNNTLQLARNKGNRQGNKSQKTQVKFNQYQQRVQNTPAPKKSGRTIKREEERVREKNATRGGSGGGDMTLSKLLIYSLLLSTLVNSGSAQPVHHPFSGHGGNNRGHDDFSFKNNIYHGGNSTSLSLNRPHETAPSLPVNISSGQFNHVSTALVHDPIRSGLYNTTDITPVKEKRIMGEMPVPRSLHVKNAVLSSPVAIGEDAGASNGLKAENTTFNDGRQWGRTYLKGAGTNYNTDNSTVRASLYNSRFLRSMGVAIPEIETIESVTGHEVDIASRDIGTYNNFKSITNDLTTDHNFTAKQREDYVKLALLSPVADLHKKNFGLINKSMLGTIDVDTALPMHSHNYRRLIDRFALAPEGYKTNDMSGSFLGEGKIQDNVFYNKIAIKETDVVNAVKAFCSIPENELADQLLDYPLQGKASQKLTLQSLRTQQEMFREAFENFEIDASENDAWVGSAAYNKLDETILKYEHDNRFPYSFKVDNGDLKITVNEKFSRKKGTGFWEDKESEQTNKELMGTTEEGHLGDVNMRLSNKTNINPADIPSLIKAAKPYLRSIGAGNQGIQFVVNLVHHPSFDKMDSESKAEVKKIFADVSSYHSIITTILPFLAVDGNPYRQAFFPSSDSSGKFMVDSYYDGGSEELRNAVEKIKKL